MNNELVQINVPLAGVRIDCMQDDSDRPGLLCPAHYHDEIELITVTEGRLAFAVDDKKQVAAAGDTIFCSARIPHATYLTGAPCAYILLQFRPEKYMEEGKGAGKYFNRFVQNTVMPFCLLHNEKIAAAMEQALAESREKRDAWALSVRGLVYAMVAELCRAGALSAPDGSSSADIEKILPALEYVDQHYAENITLSGISAVQNLNPSYFCRLFKRASGSSFIDYLNFVRVCKSEKLLLGREESILSVAYDVGFSSVSYFNRIFKKYKNCTPSAYRRAQYEESVSGGKILSAR